jgi:hypothetical protein
MRYDITEIDVCVVCIMLTANGEYDDGTDAAERCTEGQARIWGDDVRHFTMGGEELGFSWSSCDGCGDTNGGDRFRINVMVPRDENAS